MTAAPGTQHQAGVGGGVAEERLQHLGNQHGAAEEPECEQEVEDVGEREVALAQQGEFDHRIVVAPFPPDRDRDRDHGDREKSRDEVAFEPVVALAAIEHDFEAREADRDQRDADIVDPQLAAASRLLRVPR